MAVRHLEVEVRRARRRRARPPRRDQRLRSEALDAAYTEAEKENPRP